MKLICTRCNGAGHIGLDELPSNQRRLLAAVQKAAKRGVVIDDLAAEVYGDRATQHSVHMLIKRLNRRLLHAKIVADRKGPGARYHLIHQGRATSRSAASAETETHEAQP